MEDLTLPQWATRLADIEDLPHGFEMLKTYLQQNDLSKVIDLEDKEYKKLEFVRFYSSHIDHYGASTTYAVLEIEVKAAKMFFSKNWTGHHDFGQKTILLEDKRHLYRYVKIKDSKVSIEIGHGHRDLLRENFELE